MEAVIKKWGNSPALRLSISLMKTAELTINQKVTIRAQRGRIVIEPVKQAQYILDELVSGINAGNFHGEIDFGGPVGKEWR
jgi:antitoxin MazE